MNTKTFLFEALCVLLSLILSGIHALAAAILWTRFFINDEVYKGEVFYGIFTVIFVYFILFTIPVTFAFTLIFMNKLFHKMIFGVKNNKFILSDKTFLILLGVYIMLIMVGVIGIKYA